MHNDASIKSDKASVDINSGEFTTSFNYTSPILLGKVNSLKCKDSNHEYNTLIALMMISFTNVTVINSHTYYLRISYNYNNNTFQYDSTYGISFLYIKYNF